MCKLNGNINDNLSQGYHVTWWRKAGVFLSEKDFEFGRFLCALYGGVYQNSVGSVKYIKIAEKSSSTTKEQHNNEVTPVPPSAPPSGQGHAGHPVNVNNNCVDDSQTVPKKRKRRSTGGTFEPKHNMTASQVSKDDYRKLSVDEKLVTLFDMMANVSSVDTRVHQIQSQVPALKNENTQIKGRISTLEYRSIDNIYIRPMSSVRNKLWFILHEPYDLS